jgi:hypothetical protein
MTQAFLSEPTIAAAHKKYLESWSVPTVKKAWNGKKPTLEQFIARFQDPYRARQMYLKANPDIRQQVLDDRRMDDVQALAEEVHDRIGETLAALQPPRFAELDEDTAPAPKDEVADAHAAAEEQSAATEQRTVKDKNKGKLPTAKQVFFFLHRAIEAGHGFATIPTDRQTAAEVRELIANGTSYADAVLDIAKKRREGKQ